jgi:exopolysaccharide biosynthesis polyprenyl glycosylphosphotransferase
MYASLLLALAVRYKDFSFLPGPQTKIFLYHFSFISLLWIFLLFLLDFYEIPPFRRTSDFFRNLLIFIFLAGSFGVIYFYFRPQLIIAPKTILILDVLIFGVLLSGWRYIISQILKLQNFREKIVMIGSRLELKDLSPNLLIQNGYEIVASFEPDSSFEISKLKEIIEKERVSSVVLALDSNKNEDLIKKIFSSLPLKINFISFPTFYENITKKVPLWAINELWFLENLSHSEKRIEEILKRGFDIFFSVIGLAITAILFPFIALAIKIDSPGPIFYTQKRVGKEGKIFTFYKFRTMKESKTQDEEPWREKDPSQITRVGKLLRKTYLDEFPQFWNILRGDLSFVGPRPEWEKLARIFEKEIPFYRQRYLVKPGLTGWAQLNFPPSSSIEEAKEKFQYDLYYIKNRSFFFDLGIILKTIRILFR